MKDAKPGVFLIKDAGEFRQIVSRLWDYQSKEDA